MENKSDLFGSDDEEQIRYNSNEEEEDQSEHENNKNELHYSQVSPADNDKQKDDKEDGGENSSDDEVEERKVTHHYKLPYSDLEEDNSPFRVSDPVKVSHVSYKVTGKDKDGSFEGTRRYKDFHNLRNTLLARWPGVYVPQIPPKKSIGNKNEKFVNNRMYFLDLFIKKIGTISHLVNSQEFKIFARPAGDIQACLNMLPPLNPGLLKERLEKELDISPGIEESQFKQSREAVNDFAAFLKKITNTLKSIKDQAEKMVNVKDSTNKRTSTVIDVMSYYESNGLSKFVDQDVSKLVVENPNDTELKVKAESIGHTLSNSFKDFYYWVRSILGDVEAALDAISGKDRIIQTRIKLENKKKSEQSELDGLNAGKKTLKNLFKSASTKQSRMAFLTADIEKIGKEIDEYDIIVKMLNYNIAKNIIPEFISNTVFNKLSSSQSKKNQVTEYYNFINFLAKREINNSSVITSFWTDFNKNQHVATEA